MIPSKSSSILTSTTILFFPQLSWMDLNPSWLASMYISSLMSFSQVSALARMMKLRRRSGVMLYHSWEWGLAVPRVSAEPQPVSYLCEYLSLSSVHTPAVHSSTLLQSNTQVTRYPYTYIRCKSPHYIYNDDKVGGSSVWQCHLSGYHVCMKSRAF